MNQEYTVDPSRLVSPDMTPADTEEVSLRPKTLDDYVGQEKAKGNLKVYLRAAQQRGEPMDHILLYGPPGLGKPRWPASWRRRWAYKFASRPAPPSRSPATWPPC